MSWWSRQLESLPPNLQQRVLEYARELGNAKPKGVPGHSLLPFAGTFRPEDLKAMAEAIEEGCERVDMNDW